MSCYVFLITHNIYLASSSNLVYNGMTFSTISFFNSCISLSLVDFTTIYTSIRVIVIIEATDCMRIYNGNYAARSIFDTHVDPSRVL